MYKPYLKCISLEIDKGREYFLSFLSTLLYLPVSLLIYFFLFRTFMQEESCVIDHGASTELLYHRPFPEVRVSARNG